MSPMGILCKTDSHKMMMYLTKVVRAMGFMVVLSVLLIVGFMKYCDKCSGDLCFGLCWVCDLWLYD